MANLNGQKTYVSLVEEVSQWVLGKTADTTTSPTMDELRGIVNDCQREILSEHPWQFLYGTTTVSTVASQTTPYALSDSAIDILYMTIEGNSQYLSKMDLEMWKRQYPSGYTNQGNGIPLMYIPAAPASNNATQVYLFPAADAVYSITYGYKTRVTDMTAATDIPLIIPEWQDVLVSKAIYYAFHRRNDNRAGEWKQRYEERLRKMWLWNEQRTMEFLRDIGGSATRMINPYLEC